MYYFQRKPGVMINQGSKLLAERFGHIKFDSINQYLVKVTKVFKQTIKRYQFNTQSNVHSLPGFMSEREGTMVCLLH